MSATIDISLDDLYTTVGNFLQATIGVDPATTLPVAVVQGQANRVPSPASAHIRMQGQIAGRIRTNQHTYNPTLQTVAVEQGTKVKMQLDIYGPLSESWATIISTLWRDGYAVDAMKPTCAPLYTDEPFQGALVNGEEQYEDRWTVQAILQYNPVTTVAQESATAAEVNAINVDERYPP
jgi:hypothetical protein